MSSENFHPYLRRTAHEAPNLASGQHHPDAFYDLLEAILTDIVTGETETACATLRDLMRLWTLATEGLPQ